MRHRNSRARLVTSTILAGIMTAALPAAAITLLAPGVATATVVVVATRGASAVCVVAVMSISFRSVDGEARLVLQPTSSKGRRSRDLRPYCETR